MYEGELQYARNRFLDDRNHLQFNTLQAELYDSSMAEVLGRIETSALTGFDNWDWAEGHHLVIVWPNDLSAKARFEILTCWFPLIDKRLIPTAPLVARFRLWTAIVKPTEVVESNDIDQINGAMFF